MPGLASDSTGLDGDCDKDEDEVSVSDGGMGLNETAIIDERVTESSSSEDECEPRDYGHKRLVHVFADTLISRSLVEATPVKAAVDLVDADDEKYGNLIDDHAWDDMVRDVAKASGYLLTPPTCTFHRCSRC